MNENEFAVWMNRLDRAESGGALPDSGTIWWRAQLQRRLAAEEQATRPLRIAEGVSCAACILAEAVVAAVITFGGS
jgi:hypothetical protein